jgi:outer membrane protein assembly factor BamB
MWAAGPVPVILRDGQHGIVLVDHRGFLRCLDREGALLWEVQRGVPKDAAALHAGDLFRAPYDGILLLTEAGPLQCMMPDGRLLWEFPLTGRAYLGRYDPARAGRALPPFADVSGIGQRIFVATTDAAESKLCRLDAMGHLVWQRALPAPASSAPLVYPLPDEADFGVAVGLADGSVAVWHANHGKPLGQWPVAPGVAIADLMAAPLGTPPVLSLMACSALGLTAVNGDGTTRWHTPIGGALASALDLSKGVAQVYVHDAAGHLTLVQADGSVAWQSDLRATGAPLLRADTRTGHTHALVQTTTGLLRQLDLDEAPPAPVNRVVAAPEPVE